MHTYSIDREIRRTVIIGLFITSMILSWVLEYMLSGILESAIIFLETSAISNIVRLVGWLEVIPNVLGVPFLFALLTWFYDRKLWQCSWLKKWHKIPDLNGTWEGELTSSFNGKSIPIKMKIEQTWSHISFESTFLKTNSISHSNVAAIYVNSNNGIEISFAFRNNSYSVEDKLQSYDGYNILQLVDDNKIKAKYFNDREHPDPRFKGGNKGSFELERQDKRK